VRQNFRAQQTGGNVSQVDMTMGGHAQAMEAPAFAVPAKKMAMWLFIIADTATFAGCLVAYGFLRNATPNWPRPFHSITNVAIMTFILVTSSLTMLFAIEAARAGEKAKAFRWTMITAAGGAIFAILHIREWLALLDEGMTLVKNPWGTTTFGASFYSITGLHLLHVTGGVIALVAVAIRYQGGRYRADDLEITCLYWHFVDVLWLYLLVLLWMKI